MGAARSAAMGSPAPRGMTVAAFLRRAGDRSRRWEPITGDVVAMAPERAGHARAKGCADRAPVAVAAESGLPCEVFPDGRMVRIAETSAFAREALSLYSLQLAAEPFELSDPSAVVDVLSPSSRTVATGGKREDCSRVVGVFYDLVIDPKPGGNPPTPDR